MRASRVVSRLIRCARYRLESHVVLPQAGIAGPSRLPWPTAPRIQRFSTSLTLRAGEHNHDIPHNRVHLVNEQGRLDDPVPLRNVLRNTDLNTHILICVSDNPPVVKIVSREEELRRELEEKARINVRNKLQEKEKEIQVSWLSQDGDVKVKIQQARHALEKGDKVLLIFAPKKGFNKKQNTDRMEEMVEMFDDGLQEVGSKYKDDQFSGKVVSCFWRPLDQIKQAARSKLQNESKQNQLSKHEKKEERRRKTQEQMEKAQQKLEQERLEWERIKAETRDE